MMTTTIQPNNPRDNHAVDFPATYDVDGGNVVRGNAAAGSTRIAFRYSGEPCLENNQPSTNEQVCFGLMAYRLTEPSITPPSSLSLSPSLLSSLSLSLCLPLSLSLSSSPSLSSLPLFVFLTLPFLFLPPSFLPPSFLSLALYIPPSLLLPPPPSFPSPPSSSRLTSGTTPLTLV